MFLLLCNYGIYGRPLSYSDQVVRFMEDHPIETCLAASAIVSVCLSKRVRPVIIVKNAEAVVLERLGKFNRVLTPGLNFKIPVLDNPRTFAWTDRKNKSMLDTGYRIDIRERVCHLPPQGVITGDNVVMKIDALVYYKITNPQLAMYAVNDLPLAIDAIAQTSLRNEVGSMKLDETLTSRGKVNASLRNSLADIAQGWGVEITRVELQEVTPPDNITNAMAAQMSAERERRAHILDAEGRKTAAILDAEGESAAVIKRAEAAARATVLRGQAEAQALEAIARTGVSPQDFALRQKYYEALTAISNGKGNVVVPQEATAVAGIAALAQKIMQGDDAPAADKM